jgi:hypothetical protein
MKIKLKQLKSLIREVLEDTGYNQSLETNQDVLIVAGNEFGISFQIGEDYKTIRLPQSDSTRATRAYAAKIIKLLNDYKAKGVTQVDDKDEGPVMDIDTYIAKWQAYSDAA